MPIIGNCENPLALHEQDLTLDQKLRECAAEPPRDRIPGAEDGAIDDSFLAVLLRALSAWST